MAAEVGQPFPEGFASPGTKFQTLMPGSCLQGQSGSAAETKLTASPGNIVFDHFKAVTATPAGLVSGPAAWNQQSSRGLLFKQTLSYIMASGHIKGDMKLFQGATEHDAPQMGLIP